LLFRATSASPKSGIDVDARRHYRSAQWRTSESAAAFDHRFKRRYRRGTPLNTEYCDGHRWCMFRMGGEPPLLSPPGSRSRRPWGCGCASSVLGRGSVTQCRMAGGCWWIALWF